MDIKEPINVVISGVGGQGTVLASKVLAEVSGLSNLDVKQSEVHGMSQRGGDVVSQVRFGEKVYSPLITLGEADVLLSFEKLEGLRYLNYLKKTGKALISKRQIMPASVSAGIAKYPTDLEGKIKEIFPNTTFVDAEAAAHEVGNVKTVNIILLGALSKTLPFTYEMWEQAIKNVVPAKTVEINIKAFKKGRELL